MDNHSCPLADLTDCQLIAEVKALAGREREAIAGLIASLAELDARRLYLAEGFSSLFTYCTQCLHLSEHSAYNRIEVARAARRWPEILEQFAKGALTLTSIRLLAPHLTNENVRGVLEVSRHKSKREVEQMIVALHPKPDVPASIRRLPAPALPAPPVGKADQKRGSERRSPPCDAPDGLPDSAASVTPPSVPRDSGSAGAAGPVAQRPVIAPLAPERFRVQMTVSRATHDNLRRAQDLLRHSIPDGDPAQIFDRALTLLVEHLERTKLASAQRPREPRGQQMGSSRHIPSAVKRTVWQRDAGQCAFVGTQGRCAERGFLEFHHVVPYADRGPATVENIHLLCRAHNQSEAEAWFGSMFARERPPDTNRTSGGLFQAKRWISSASDPDYAAAIR